MKIPKTITYTISCVTAIFLLLSFTWRTTEAIVVTDPCSCSGGPQEKTVTPADIAGIGYVIDGATAAFQCVNTFKLQGNFPVIRFVNLQGSATCPILIINNDQVEIGSLTPPDNLDMFRLTDCNYVEISGAGPVSSPSATNCPGGIRVKDSPAGRSGLSICGSSSHIEIHHLAIEHISSSGIVVKNSPVSSGSTNSCNATCDNTTAGDDISHINIHHNCIYDVGNEGLYIGDSFFRGKGTNPSAVFCPPYIFPQKITNVEIWENTIMETGWDAIQVGAAVDSAVIRDNICHNYGDQGSGTHSNGIQLGEGCQGVSCYNNLIKNDAPGGLGNGIICLGAGNNCIYNNIMVYPGVRGIEVHERSEYREATGGCYDLSNNDVGSSFLHNTIIFPDDVGIKLFRGNSQPSCLPANSTTTLTGGYVVNNLVIANSSTVDLIIPKSNQGTPNAGDMLAQNWSEINASNKVIIGTLGLFVDAANDDYTPVDDPNSEIIDSAYPTSYTPPCSVSSDYYGMARIINGIADFGAVEADHSGNCGKDADKDGICSEDDCDDNDASVGAIQPPGTPCDDGDATTTNDVIQADGCTCLGEPKDDCNGPTATVTGCGVTLDLDGLTASFASTTISGGYNITFLYNGTAHVLCNAYSNNPPCTPGVSHTFPAAGTYKTRVVSLQGTCDFMVTVSCNNAKVLSTANPTALSIADERADKEDLNAIRAVPNPFNLHTELRFVALTDGAYQVDVYDMSGKNVWTVRAAFSVGPNHFILPGRAFTSSGIYYLRLTTPSGEQSSTRVVKF